MKRTSFLILILFLAVVAIGCSAEKAVPEEAVEQATTAAEAVDPDPLEEVMEAAAGEAAETAEVEAGENPIPVKEVVAEAEAAVDTALETAKETVAETVTGAVAEAAAKIEVAATKEGLTRIGDTKCKVCHKIQHASWADSSHAGLDPVLDCESCHGPGSEYKKMSIMKNREQAIAAGLVLPEAAFCKNCHADDWDDGMLEAAHEHKPAT
jgi:hypothetical protein